MSHPIFTCIILISLRLNLFVCSVRTQNKLYPILLFLQISYLPPPWEDCGSVPLKDTPYYSRKSCHFECETDFIVDKCGCQLLSMRRRGVPVCHPLNETQCAVPAKHVYMEQGWPCAQYVQHYSDVIMGTMASQITSLTIVYSTVYSGTDQRNRKSSASLAFVGEICRWPGNSLHKGPATRKCFHFNDVIMVICDIIFLCVYALLWTIRNPTASFQASMLTQHSYFNSVSSHRSGIWQKFLLQFQSDGARLNPKFLEIFR